MDENKTIENFDEDYDEYFDGVEEAANKAMKEANAPSTMGLIGAALFGVVLVGGLGYIGYRKFFGGKKKAEDGTGEGSEE